MQTEKEEDEKEEEEASKCYFRNSFCPFLSVFVRFCPFLSVFVRSDKSGHKT